LQRVILGVTGGIAAYRAGDIIRGLKKKGADVTCIMTKSAKEFITPLTLRKLSGNPVYDDMFLEGKKTSSKIKHIDLARNCDSILIAPATANIIGKIASGIADDLLTTVVMASEKKVLIAPAMNKQMWKNRIVKANVKKLEKNGYIFIGPVKGELACGETGEGHIESTDKIVRETIKSVKKKALKGKTVLITSGATREFIDKVRFISNPSSGKTGYFLAKEAVSRGAKLIFISGKSSFMPEKGKTIKVVSASDMFLKTIKHYKKADIIIGAAAVGDFQMRSAKREIRSKIPREKNLIIQLKPTIDILAEIGKKKGKRILVGFSAEAGKSPARSKQKIKKKNLDLVVFNDVSKKSGGFESDNNSIIIIDSRGRAVFKGKGAKEKLAAVIFDKIEKLM